MTTLTQQLQSCKLATGQNSKCHLCRQSLESWTISVTLGMLLVLVGFNSFVDGCEFDVLPASRIANGLFFFGKFPNFKTFMGSSLRRFSRRISGSRRNSLFRYVSGSTVFFLQELVAVFRWWWTCRYEGQNSIHELLIITGILSRLAGGSLFIEGIPECLRRG